MPASPEQLQAGLLAAFFVPGTTPPDLSLRSLSVLLAIGPGAVPRSVGSLADELGLERAQLRRGIATLERNGLALRLEDSARGRGALVLATAAGARLMHALAGGEPMRG